MATGVMSDSKTQDFYSSGRHLFDTTDDGMDAVAAVGLSGKSREGKMVGKQIVIDFRLVGLIVAIALLVSLPVSAQQPATQPPAPADAAAPQGPGLVPAGDASQMNINAGEANAAAAGAHPLEPALELAAKGLASIQANIKDYSCTMVKRERIDGKLGEHQYMFAKVRRQPYSVYLYFLGPEDVKGQEVIYVDGKNDNNMLAHAGSGVRAMVGTVSLKPQSMLAMTGNRYPITEFGVERLAERLVEVAEHDKQFGECEVNFFPNAKVNGRICTCVQVVHPVPRRNFRFHLARVFIDDELLIPVRYEAYDWPHEAGGQPVLMEEYTYMNVKTNQGFTDADFDPANPSYKFGGKK